MQQLGGCLPRMAVHDHDWGKSYPKILPRGGTSNAWTGKPAPSCRTSKLGAMKPIATSIGKGYQKNERQVLSVTKNTMHKSNNVSDNHQPTSNATVSELRTTRESKSYSGALKEEVQQSSSGKYSHTNNHGNQARTNSHGNQARTNNHGNQAHTNNHGNQAHTNDDDNYTHNSSKFPEESGDQHLPSTPPPSTFPSGSLPRSTRAPLLAGTAIPSSRARPRKKPDSWHEDLFAAIAADNVHAVAHLFSRFRLVRQRPPEGASTASSRTASSRTASALHPRQQLDVDALLFGVFVLPRPEASAKLPGTKRFRFVGYGAPARAVPDRQWLRAATAQHVAVWAGATAVAEHLVSLGASSSVCDGLGVSVYQRAQSAHMRSVLRRPPRPADLRVLSMRGGCVLQWRCAEAFPPVEAFRVADLRHQLSWDLALADLQVHGTSRRGTKTLICRLPRRHVWSAHEYQFTVQACNSEGFWGDPSHPSAPVAAPHWVSDWARARPGPPPSTPPAPGRPARFVPLRLGAVDLGEVPPEEYFPRVLEAQRRAATRIQALFRGVTSRGVSLTLRFAWEAARRREKAATAIQRAARGGLVRAAVADWEAAKERYLRGEPKKNRTRKAGSKQRREHKGRKVGRLLREEAIDLLQAEWNSQGSQSEAPEPINLGFKMNFPPSWRT